MAAIPETRSDWASLTRRSAVAPFVLKIGPADGQSAGIGRNVDLWFVVYGDLKTLSSDEFLQAQFRGASSDDDNRPRAKLLAAADLKSRGIVNSNEVGSYYLTGDFTVLDKVRVRGTTQSVKTSTPDSIVCIAPRSGICRGRRISQRLAIDHARRRRQAAAGFIAALCRLRFLRQGNATDRAGRSGAHRVSRGIRRTSSVVQRCQFVTIQTANRRARGGAQFRRSLDSKTS